MYDSELHSGGFRGGAWGGAPYLLFLDQSDAQRAEENFLGDCTPLISRSGSGTAASRNATIKLPSESFEEEEENNTFFASMETIGAPDEICGVESQKVMGLNPNLGLGLFPSFHLMQKTYHFLLLLQKTRLVISMSPLFNLRQSAVTVPWDRCTDKN